MCSVNMKYLLLLLVPIPDYSIKQARCPLFVPSLSDTHTTSGRTRHRTPIWQSIYSFTAAVWRNNAIRRNTPGSRFSDAQSKTQRGSPQSSFGIKMIGMLTVGRTTCIIPMLSFLLVCLNCVRARWIIRTSPQSSPDSYITLLFYNRRAKQQFHKRCKGEITRIVPEPEGTHLALN